MAAPIFTVPAVDSPAVPANPNQPTPAEVGRWYDFFHRHVVGSEGTLAARGNRVVLALTWPVVAVLRNIFAVAPGLVFPTASDHELAALKIQQRNFVKFCQFDGAATITPVPLPKQVGGNAAGTVPPAALNIPANFEGIPHLTPIQANAILAFYGVQISAGATLPDRYEMIRDVLVGGLIL
eukprot:TRINITY_DN10164_c0_g1_i1.p2 TRINITY_DN10164_c0_g1~~TRINITY_DN10164_c0_g1_i1.p2  ORF type:complete len:181 (+),score=33.83 TRINITY_DN10164_c0_g1_i1:259-801(+)